MTEEQSVGTQVSWRSDDNDLPHRSKIIRQISKMLEQRKENPDPKWIKDLPFKTRKLEEYLYKNAQSLEEYADEKSLKQRMKKAALSIARQIRIEKAYSSGLWSRPSPRNSLVSIGRDSLSSTVPLLSVGPDIFQSPNDSEQSPPAADLWDAATSSKSTNWDVQSRRSSSISQIEGLSLPLESTDDEPPALQVKVQQVPRVSFSELSDLKASNEKLTKDLLASIKRQQDTLRDEYNVIPPSPEREC